jgi:quercetin dioxygenase-like cupin family protein
MNAKKNWVTGVSAVVSVGLLAATAGAQDPVKVAPKNYKTLLENDHVRVCELTVKTGDKVAMHSHPDHVVYILKGAEMKLSYPEGKGQPKELKQKPGETLWIPSQTHEGENIGKEDFLAVVFELKGSAAASASAEKKTAEIPEHAKVLFENERVRVIETVLKPGDKSAMHSHPANVIYAVTAAKAKFTDAEGKTSEKELAAGQTVWSEPVKHAVENTGQAEARVLNVELKGLAAKTETPKPAEKKP